MDAVELPLPVGVAAAPKLMGSEGFQRPSVVVKEVEPRNDRVSLIVTHSNSIDRCTENGDSLFLPHNSLLIVYVCSSSKLSYLSSPQDLLYENVSLCLWFWCFDLCCSVD